MTIYKHFAGYAQARQEVLAQSLAEDLQLIDGLYGRDNLRYGDDDRAVKAEALRQLEIAWRDGEDERATFWVSAFSTAKGVR